MEQGNSKGKGLTSTFLQCPGSCKRGIISFQPIIFKLLCFVFPCRDFEQDSSEWVSISQPETLLRKQNRTEDMFQTPDNPEIRRCYSSSSKKRDMPRQESALDWQGGTCTLTNLFRGSNLRAGGKEFHRKYLSWKGNLGWPQTSQS